MINEHPEIDGFFGFIEQVVIGALKVFNEKKIKVPKQVLVIDFGNWFMNKTTTPSLTTVDQFPYEMWRKVFELLLENLNQIKEGKVL